MTMLKLWRAMLWVYRWFNPWACPKCGRRMRNVGPDDIRGSDFKAVRDHAGHRWYICTFGYRCDAHHAPGEAIFVR